MKKLSSLLLCLLLAVSLALPVCAADASVTVKAEGIFTMKPGSEFTKTDLFDNFKDVMPGDVRTQEVQIKNNWYRYDFIRVYLRAVPHSSSNPLSASVAKTETVASMEDFLSQLSMTVSNKRNGTMFRASPDELDGLKENVHLTTLDRGESTTLEVELSVPITLGNEYANRAGEVDWIFTVEGGYYSDSPKTGDYIMAAVGVLAVSGIALAVLFILKKRKSDNTQ